MPSGKTSRRTRQAPTPPPPRSGDGRRRQASPKVLIGAAVVAVIAGIAIALAVILGGGSSSSTNLPAIGRIQGGLPGAADVQKLFQGIPQKSNILGQANAPVTMVEYVDLQCPFCREFETVVLPQLLSRYVRTGKLRIDQRLLAILGPDSADGRDAALAAGEQNKQFNFSELLYFNQGVENTGWLDQQMIDSAAASIPGMRVQQMLDAQGSDVVAATAAQLDAEARTAGVSSTPTILVGKTGATPEKVALASAEDLQSVTAAIDAALGSG